MRFSIIIPVYNVERYIRKCMESIMNQTFRDYEVIVVDDESPDNSMRIVEEFASSYPGMVTMIHQKNTRQGGARNRGVREAKGEYILFVDSDDYVSTKMLEICDREIRKHDCDIFAFKYDMVSPEGKYLGEGGFGSLKAGKYIPARDKQIMMLPAGPVHKAYRTSFYRESGMAFPEKVLYEDAVVRLLFAKASSVVLHEESLYYYVQSGNSSIRQKPSERMLDILKVTDLVIREFKKADLYDAFQEPLETSLLYGITYILDLINQVDVKNDLQNRMVEYIAENFPAYGNNPYVDTQYRNALDCLVNREFIRYHYQFLLFVRFKEWLLRFRIVSELNKLRKR